MFSGRGQFVSPAVAEYFSGLCVQFLKRLFPDAWSNDFALFWHFIYFINLAKFHWISCVPRTSAWLDEPSGGELRSWNRAEDVSTWFESGLILNWSRACFGSAFWTLRHSLLAFKFRDIHCVNICVRLPASPTYRSLLAWAVWTWVYQGVTSCLYSVFQFLPA